MADAIPLTLEERNRLIRIFSGLYDFIEGPRNRRVFLQETARLGRFIPGMDLSGAPRTVVADLIGQLEVFGHLPEQPAYHALGALLNAGLGLGELPRADAIFLASLIVHYSLVNDPSYIASLRADYSLSEPARITPAAEANHPALFPEEIQPGPDFSVSFRDSQSLEQVINSDDNFLDLYLLTGALYCSMAVCRIEAPEGKALGTGFLVNKNILLTNQHVLKDRDILQEAVARFGYMVDASGVAERGQIVRFDPDFYHASPAEELDYVLSRLEEEPLRSKQASGAELNQSMIELFRSGKHRGSLTLAARQIRENDRLNIIQHPDGDPMKVVLTQNHVIADMTARRVQYVADTKNGSSGSPVFNQKWEIVALHHSGSPYPPESAAEITRKAWKGHFRTNEGVPMRAILEDFKTRGLMRHLPQS